MTRYPNRFWTIVFGLGLFFDFLFWKQTAGLNFAIFITITLIGAFYLLFVNQKRPARNSLLLLVPIALFAVLTFARREPLTLFMAYLFTLFSLGILAFTYLGGRWMQYGLTDYLASSIQLIVNLIVQPFSFFGQVRSEQAERGETNKVSIFPILRGLLIAIPIVAIFAALLSSADVVFSRKLADFFELDKTGEYFNRFLIIVFIAYVLAGVLLYIATQSQDEKLSGETKLVIKPFIGFTEAAIVLGSVTALFLAFVVIQFQYFFGGSWNIAIAGYSYSQYARRGFNELVIVAFFSLMMILGLSALAKRESNMQRWVYSGLSIAIVLLVLVILVSAYQRLMLAIDWHGFSRLRLYPQVFLVWVGILLLGVVILEVLRRERYFAFAAVLASMGFVATLGFLNIDDSIVRYNVLRATYGRHFNPAYLASLSIDSVPALTDEFLNPKLPPAVHEGVGAALLCQLNSNDFVGDIEQDWRSFSLPRWNAQMAFERVKVPLAAYRINEERYPMRVRTPSNVFYDCESTEPTARQ